MSGIEIWERGGQKREFDPEKRREVSQAAAPKGERRQVLAVEAGFV